MEDELEARPETVSKEAHERVTSERNVFKAQLGEAQAALVDTKLLHEAQDYYSGKVKDPIQAAKMVLPDIRSMSDEDKSHALESALPAFAPVTSAELAEEPKVEEPTGVVPESPPAPSFMSPSPASDGPPPASERLNTKSDEFQALVKANDLEGIKRLDAEGRIDWHPLNESAKAKRTGGGE